MTCNEIQNSFLQYHDGSISSAAREVVEAHLSMCPICRSEIDKLRLVVRNLSLLPKPEVPEGLEQSITNALSIEAAARASEPHLSLYQTLTLWLKPRIMPYTVGAFASLILFFNLASALRPHVQILRQLGPGQLAQSEFSTPGDSSRFTSESPSLNPSGAIASLVRSPEYMEHANDEMVVVADVYGNGSASVADIVYPPKNACLISELQAALRKSPAFVPAYVDHRPQTVRVVLSISNMSVHEQSF
jgi:hypothetical protein